MLRWGKPSGTSRESDHGTKGQKHVRVEGKHANKRKETRRFWRSRCMTNPVADLSLTIKACPTPKRKSSLHVPKNLEVKRSSVTTGIHENPVLDLNVSQEQELKKRVESKEDAKHCANENFVVKGGILDSGHMQDANRESGNVLLDPSSGGSKIAVHEACKMTSPQRGCTDSHLKRGTVHDKGGDKHYLQRAVGKTAFDSCLDNRTILAVGDKSCEANRGLRLKSVPPNLVNGLPERLGECEAVVSQQAPEAAQIKSGLNEENDHCPTSHEPSPHLQHELNHTNKILVCSLTSLASHGSAPDSTHQNSFSSCITNFSCCPSSMNGSNEIFVSCSSFSIPKLLEGMELDSFSTCLSSCSNLLLNPEFRSPTRCSSSACSSNLPEHLDGMCNGNCILAFDSIGSLSHAEQELQFSPQEIEVLDENKSMQGNISSRQWDRLMEMISLSRRPLKYSLSRIQDLVLDLNSEYIDIRRNAVAELRLLAKHEDSNRILIVNAGAVRPLIMLLWSGDSFIQLDATTALLNLSLNHSLKECLVNEGAIDGLVGVLRDGLNELVKANAAAALAYLAVHEANIRKIGSAGAITPLVDLLETGSLRGKKDAAAALYKLSSLDENKRGMVRARTLKPLVGFMYKDSDEKEDMVDKAMAIVTNLVSIEEGRIALVKEGGIMSLLHVIKLGSQRSRCLAVPILLQLCVHDRKHRSLVQQSEPLPTLISLSKTANSRLKVKIAEIIDVLVITSG